LIEISLPKWSGGALLIVWAIAEGQRIAAGIDKYLQA